MRSMRAGGGGGGKVLLLFPQKLTTSKEEWNSVKTRGVCLWLVPLPPFCLQLAFICWQGQYPFIPRLSPPHPHPFLVPWFEFVGHVAGIIPCREWIVCMMG